MTTLDNSLKNLVEDGPVSFKPGFEFLQKTQQDVNTFIATGVFSIVPVSPDDQHPGYLMEADTAAKAQEWVSTLNKVRDEELATTKAELAVCDQLKTKDDQLKLNDELLAELAVCKEQLKAKEEFMAAMRMRKISEKAHHIKKEFVQEF